MGAGSFLSTNAQRAYRLIFHGDRLGRARNYVAWQRHLAELRRQHRSRVARGRARRANQQLLQRELRQQATVLASHPTTLSIDPSSVCNLRCPFCPTGAGFGDFERTLLTPARFDRIISHLRVDLIQRVELYNWGEPLLNPHLFDFIRFFSLREAETEISTNFSHRDYDESFLARLVESGLGTLVVSVDGADQESYGKYRIRGSLERVLGNMRRLDAVKRELRSERPLVIYKMLLHRFNQHQVEEAARLASEHGATFLLNERFWCPDSERETWVARAGERAENGSPVEPPGRIQGYSTTPQEVISTYCRQLWESIIVTATGDVHPCCLTFESRHAIGNLETDDISSIRNSERAVALRRYVTDPTAAAPSFVNGCEGCTSRWCVAQSSGRPVTPLEAVSGAGRNG
jgi:radical SAM protein with 4Fe4S-binding SPASM domain